MVGDAMFFHEGDEIMLRVAAERGNAEMRILRQEILRRGVQVGEIAPPAAGYADFPSDFRRVVEQQHALSAFARLRGAHQARRTCADNDDIV